MVASRGTCPRFPLAIIFGLLPEVLGTCDPRHARCSPRQTRSVTILIGEPHCAFSGNQFDLTVLMFVHYGVCMWVPEFGGPIDPNNEAHDLVMSVVGGMSKGE